MNGTRSTPGSTLCGIVLLNGRDCNGYVNPDYGLNLCHEHLEAAFQTYPRFADIPSTPKPECPICRHPSMHAGTTGQACAFCGYQTVDFAGTVLTYQEVEHEQSTRPLEYIPHPDVVYYIRFGDRIKIGTTRNIRRRLTAIPHDEVLATEPGGRSLEARRHNEFKALRITGEWFESAPELLAHIETLRA